MEEIIRKTQCQAFEQALMRWQAENEGDDAQPSSVVDGFVDVDLHEQQSFSCSTSCTSEDVSHCITPSTEIDNPLEDVFFVGTASPSTERKSTYEFATTNQDEDADLFFMPSSSSRTRPQIDALNMSSHHERSDSWEYEYALTPRTPNIQK
jgi:hypothetical protein